MAKTKTQSVAHSAKTGKFVSKKEAATSPDTTFVTKKKKVKTTGLDFSAALILLKKGKAVQRSGWNGKGLVVKAQFPDANSKMTLPYLFIEYPADAVNTPGARCPWLASQTDIMADDWQLVKEKK